MKRLTTLVIISAVAILALGTAPIVLAGGNAAKERLLSQSGFRLKTVTTDRQREQIQSLPEGQVSAITYQHKLYYVYPTTQKDQVFVGKQQQFDAYKQVLSGAIQPDMVTETAGPNHVKIEQFDGFGPMNPFGDE
jgi:hypothetical protein